jgi:predicted methyltransferase
MLHKFLAMGLFTLTTALAPAAWGPVAAAEGPPADALTDPAMKGPEVIAFIGLKPGSKVADIVAGRFERALSQAVGPTGKVYAVEPAEVIKAHPQVLTLMQGLSSMPAYSNVVLSTDPIDALALPPGLDAVFIRQNYHDLHDKFMGPADVARFDRHVFEALKPGGVFVVLDHAGAPGSGLRDTETLHRIDIAAVKAEVEAAGFVLDAESPILANPADDHAKTVFDPSIRGKTDQFLLRFRKPG